MLHLISSLKVPFEITASSFPSPCCAPGQVSGSSWREREAVGPARDPGMAELSPCPVPTKASTVSLPQGANPAPVCAPAHGAHGFPRVPHRGKGDTWQPQWLCQVCPVHGSVPRSRVALSCHIPLPGNILNLSSGTVSPTGAVGQEGQVCVCVPQKATFTSSSGL